MNTLFNPFRAPSRKGTEWFSVGLVSSFPDVGLDESEHRLCGSHGADSQRGCKVFHAPKTDSSQPVEVVVPTDDMAQDLADQVLVFQYRGKFHAIDHGIPFDIEDFGIVLSAGITCPKHNWSFDLFSGRSDRGNYRLKVWEVELREQEGTRGEAKEVWVRRKLRVG
ncbi:hypothetical protein MMYC01_205096 [Madurella mycetomatis]|uniref:Rieske domain-containing protein n=1 Tax=Madurella mycetomatis TaxID=100816 RepID=A0A175W593_9PEZI|nr:hypothetical protein MMYC01_205096 [Madurella mycetomatis]